MQEPDYRGIAALVIAACGAVGIFIMVPTGVLMGWKVGEVGSDVLIALGGVLVGAMATYMGMKVEQKILSQAPPKTTQEPTEKDDANA